MHPGVEAVFTAADLPPYKMNTSNRRGIIFPEEEVLFHGQPVAAVLASDPHVAEEALALIEVDYEALPPVVDPIAAMVEDSPLVRSPLSDVDRSEERGHVTVERGAEGGRRQALEHRLADELQARRHRGRVRRGGRRRRAHLAFRDGAPELHRAALDDRRLRRFGRAVGLDEHAGALLHPRRAGRRRSACRRTRSA